ncbi:MAG: hypothetical protein FWH41_00215 [Treponema sp.]|nr:hypothetical protein [Treponema sp.]
MTGKGFFVSRPGAQYPGMALALRQIIESVRRADVETSIERIQPDAPLETGPAID